MISSVMSAGSKIDITVQPMKGDRPLFAVHEADAAGLVDFTRFAVKEGIRKHTGSTKRRPSCRCDNRFRTLLVRKSRVRLVLVAFAQPDLKTVIKPLERLRFLQRGFTQKAINDAIKAFDLTRCLRRVRLSKHRPNTELGTSSRSSISSGIAFRCRSRRPREHQILNGLAETVLDDGLVHGIELAMQHKPRGVIHESNQEHLLHRSTRTNGQIRDHI